MDFIESVVEANQEICKMLSNDNLDLKKRLDVGAGGDVSRVADMEAEKIFVKYLHRFGKIISEESGEIGEGEDEIVIDPLDGSENFISSFPYFGSSVARRRGGEVIDGIVTNFATKEVYFKTKNNSVKVGDLYKKNFSEINADSYATIGIYERAYASNEFVCRLNKEGIKYRSPGALALSLAKASSYNFVIFEGKIREYDVSAALFLCRDLNIYKKSNFLIVSKYRNLFEKLVNLSRGL